MGQKATMRQQARATARARRVAMDAERDARDRRIEEATTEALVLLAERTRIEQEFARASRAVAEALQLVLAEGVSVEAAATLVDLEVGEARRLLRLASTANAVSPSAPSGVKPVAPRLVRA